jgi:hypothetical protein
MNGYGYGNPELNSQPLTFGIGCTALEVKDPAGLASNLIIQSTDQFQVVVHFELDGAMAPALLGAAQYQVDVYYGAVGGSASGLLASTGPLNAFPVPSGPNYHYAPMLTVAPGSLPDGVYKLTAIIRINGWPITAFFEGTVIEIFS